LAIVNEMAISLLLHIFSLMLYLRGMNVLFDILNKNIKHSRDFLGDNLWPESTFPVSVTQF